MKKIIIILVTTFISILATAQPDTVTLWINNKPLKLDAEQKVNVPGKGIMTAAEAAPFYSSFYIPPSKEQQAKDSIYRKNIELMDEMLYGEARKNYAKCMDTLKVLKKSLTLASKKNDKVACGKIIEKIKSLKYEGIMMTEQKIDVSDLRRVGIDENTGDIYELRLYYSIKEREEKEFQQLINAAMLDMRRSQNPFYRPVYKNNGNPYQNQQYPRRNQYRK